MTDARSPADDVVNHLDRLAAAILDDVGDGPTPSTFAAAATAARESVAKIGIPAFIELTGLIVKVADALLDGSTEWSPSLGGTLMAAVDDLRSLVVRSSEFGAEEGEHLHHRAAELAVYARRHAPDAGALQPEPPPLPPPPSGDLAPEPPPLPPPPSGDLEPETPPLPPKPFIQGAAVSTAPSATPHPPAQGQPLAAGRSHPSPSRVVPINDLFFPEGPQVVSGGVPKSAGARSDLLGAAVEALDKLDSELLATPLASGPMTVVPVEALTYRGRPALERAAVIREQIKGSGSQATPAALDEMYDLIDLALKD